MAKNGNALKSVIDKAVKQAKKDEKAGKKMPKPRAYTRRKK